MCLSQGQVESGSAGQLSKVWVSGVCLSCQLVARQLRHSSSIDFRSLSLAHATLRVCTNPHMPQSEKRRAWCAHRRVQAPSGGLSGPRAAPANQLLSLRSWPSCRVLVRALRACVCVGYHSFSLSDVSLERLTHWAVAASLDSS